MKIKYKQYAWITILIFTGFMLSCNKKDAYLGYTPGKGMPTITSVHTLSKTFYNDTLTTIAQSYDTSGTLTTTMGMSVKDSTYAFDSVTNAGNLGNYYVIHGTNLGSATAIYFNGTRAYFNRSLGTDQTIVVAVPSKTPYYGPNATDSLVVTTTSGKAYYKFTIIAPPPTPSTYSNYNFSAGSQISLTGVGFLNVNSVSIVDADTPGDSATVSIVSQNDSLLVLKFPATAMYQGYLKFNYTTVSGKAALTAKQELVDIDNAYQIFTDNFGPNGWGNNSWHYPSGVSTAEAISGTSSFLATYPKGSWQIEGFNNWYPSLPYSADYKYISFWVKGGLIEHTLNIQTNTSSLGYGQNDGNPITVPANVWTYFKIPISTLDFWTHGSTLQTLGFFLKGPDNADEVYYFDDVVLIK
ncbi:cell shape determination protein CcmA [Arachidicoccus soli]|uniref:Cell shape determination protein CcmA n=1 Tax=Arachidicoccus soli TaxID=2341117 RepID=A0A386HMG1_9BACT|nr:cell shape determination protein CcmA [Arachidicoccus soli]AYD47087.1 cell shape determination protein CcmA [Arachidicoccus soli]